MAPTYHQPSVEPIVEDSEDESSTRPRGGIRSTMDPSSSQRSERNNNEKMPPARSSASKPKSRKSHKSSSSSTSSKHGIKTKMKTQSSGSSSSVYDRESYLPPARKHERTRSGRIINSGDSSDSDGEAPVEDHREVLARGRLTRLTSPSVFSVQTHSTTATNTSSGSSGSNSTVTQASVSKGSGGKRAEEDQAPPSPAVPDPPDVFAYMEHDSLSESFAPFTSPSPIPHDIKQSRHMSTSSASSSFHSDNNSEQAADIDTDRSTSPERSIKGDEQRDGDEHHDETSWDAASTLNHENDGYSSSASAKLEAQMRAAQERQSLHERRTGPNPSYSHPHLHHQPSGSSTSQALTPRAPPNPRPDSIPPMPEPERIPFSGYNLLAQTLSSPARKFPPIYRRFEALNHRILLGLQDEIMELEEELRRLDDWDTNARSFGVSVSVPRNNHSETLSQSSRFSGSSDWGHDPADDDEHSMGSHERERLTHIARHIHPSSRRHEARYPTDLTYSKSQLLQTLQYKLALYNNHLKSFNETASLSKPVGQDVAEYRQFLRWESPVIEAESKYLEEAVEKDLVVIGGQLGDSHRTKDSTDSNSIVSISPRFRRSTSASSVVSEQFSQNTGNPGSGDGQIPLGTLATALASAFLIPILTFGIIPNWLGRMTVVLLVGLGVWGGVWQSLSVVGNGEIRECMVGGDMLLIAGVYGGVMAIVAAIVG